MEVQNTELKLKVIIEVKIKNKKTWNIEVVI